MGHHSKILIIDDDRPLLDSFSAFLEDSGFETLTAPDGKSGLDLFRQRRPDLVLLDMRMPGTHGLEVMNEIRELAPDTPIIVVSGAGVLDDVVHALRQGAQDFFIKPVHDLSLLEHSVRRALEHADLKREHTRYQQRLEEDIDSRTRQLVEANRKLQEEIRRRDAAEAAMAASLREKELLLKEVHHRVKNNLQIISSLLNLQADAATEDATRRSFMESRQRVASMALVHEKLYQAEDFSHVDMGVFLRELIGQHTCAADQCGAIATHMSEESLQLSINQAIPCGLVLNELTSNVIRHAFPGNRTGTLRVHMTRQNQHAELVVEDDGVGLPPGFSASEAESLGMRLIFALVGQLHGTVEFESEKDKGVRCRIDFPMPPAPYAAKGEPDKKITAEVPILKE
ncbi:histidine kinase [Oceanidesulfovibrio indonesiensis]|uniref:histidine kinase n=1 Tax=Oceanidesulfovibrio indonesiensis TaxID=54767 RepID=A0A7M3MH02_9BACT|nr:response regulator [Oceanidesulfovibrio indonesiensis]TVM18766.1 histidine kinase [Oceanidesulfovibrio indonesiensis]